MLDQEFWLFFIGGFAWEFVALHVFNDSVKNRSGYLSQYRRTLRPVPLALRTFLYGLTAYLVSNDGSIEQVIVATACSSFSAPVIFIWENGGVPSSRPEDE
tara:strand:- start:630 stop:932 length:303 start_codon:yes stop_codon:yes gene_type:complete